MFHALTIKMTKNLEKLAKEHGTPLLLIDHDKIRRNYREFKKRLPRVQIYYAVKANSEPEIISTLYQLGSSFDVASISELNKVLNEVRHLELDELQQFIWNNIIYAHPCKDPQTLEHLNPYKPLVTYDCIEEVRKIKRFCPNAGVLLRLKVSNDGAIVQLSNKFGIEPEKAVDLIGATIEKGIQVEGVSFHVGSQCTNPENYSNALKAVAQIFREAEKRKYEIGETVTSEHPIRLIDIGGGFPIKYNGDETSFRELARIINRELNELFPENSTRFLAEPGRFIVADTGTIVTRVMLAKHSGRETPAYYIDEGLYGTFSAIPYDHLKPKLKSLRRGEKRPSFVFGPTCDGIDAIAGNPYFPHLDLAQLPRLKEGDIVYAKNMGAYTNASSSNFNGMPGARIVHINV